MFRPVVDLHAGAAVLVEAGIEAAPPQGRDAALAAQAAEQAARHEALLLGLDALTVAHAPAQLDLVHEALRRMGRRPREVILCVGGRVGAADRRALLTAVARLRSYGYFVALGTASVPIDLVAEIEPYLIRLEPELTTRAGAQDAAGAVLTTLADLCERIGGRLLATQVTDEAQLHALARAGVRLAQGPWFAPLEWRPAQGVNLPATAPPERDQTQRWIGPRVGECLVPAVTLPESATAEQVLDLFSARQDATSVILLDAWQRPAAALDRNRFLLAVSGPYGHALHARRPAARLAAPPRLVPRTVPAVAALQAAGRDTERVYDDLVVTDEVGRCLGVVRVGDLIRRLGDA
ncbi:MAG: EAL domain-containing protein [Streptosporangiales bacterium]|nr:EAL domain-containing protein [Streptosporangiales bacterium]